MDWAAFNETFIAENLDGNGDLAPPWVRFPTYHRMTIGWRMGSGETWMGAWHQWMQGMPKDEVWRRAYLSRHSPAPLTWADFVHRILYSRGGKPDIDALLAAGLLSHDVAYDNWLRQVGEAMEPPWGRQSPAQAARYGSRPYAFWARWTVEQRRAGTLSAWPALSTAPRKWQGVAAALKSGTVPAGGPPAAKGFAFLAVEQVVHGTARPPWSLGISPEHFDNSVDINTHYANAWALWVRCRFDDAKTFQQYRHNHTQAPPAWDTIVNQHLTRLMP